MGRKRKKQARRDTRAEIATTGSEASSPASAFDGRWLSRFALAFLIILVLLWLFAPPDEKNRPD